MATKKITLQFTETGITVYCIIRREADDYRLDDGDGSFVSSPADPYLSLSEDGVIKGLYQVSESRVSWNNGRYTIAAYKQDSTSPVPVNDIIIGQGDMYIVSDTEIVLNNNVDTILADTNEVQGKLPTNYIMGSSDQTDKDDEIDAIKAKTDNLPGDPASETNVNANETKIDALNDISTSDIDTALATYDGPTRSEATSDKNEILSDTTSIETKIDTMLTRLSAVRAGYLDNLSGGPVALAAVTALEASLTAMKGGGWSTETLVTIEAAINALNDLASGDIDTALITYDGIKRSEATTDKDEIITQVNANETKIDALNDISAADVDNLLTANHGAGQWDATSVIGTVILTDNSTNRQIIAKSIKIEDISGESEDSGSVFALLNKIYKVETGRWKITNNQMIFYDDDNTTPLFTFDLKDSSGNATEDSPVERTPA